MRKRTAWICCISAALVVGGYVAWCGRSYYLPARFPDFHELPPEVAAMLPPLLESRGMMVPARFRVDDFSYFLSHPYQSRGAVEIHHLPLGSNAMAIYRDKPDGIPQFAIVRQDGKWTVFK